MNVEQMLGQSGILTLLGMGVVFSFLIIIDQKAVVAAIAAALKAKGDLQ